MATLRGIRPLVARLNHARVGTKRNISFLGAPPASLPIPTLQNDLKRAVEMVKAHDPAGYIPGRLLPNEDMSVTYYAVRSFWCETGLRIGSTADVAPTAPPIDHVEWWQSGIDSLYDNKTDDNINHSTLRLLQYVIDKHGLSKQYFDNVLMGRRQDVDLKQYPTVDSLKQHATLSCGGLFQLVMQSGDVTSPQAFEAAKRMGVAHGLANALRTSIPVVSTTGKLVIPQDLCERYGVKSPRYLLSALGLGDEECRAAFHNAVRDIVFVARENLQVARSMRDELLKQKDGEKAVAVLIPGLASETFLNRLQDARYDLTNRDLRNVGLYEHAVCVGRMVQAYYQKQY